MSKLKKNCNVIEFDNHMISHMTNHMIDLT